MTVHDLLKKLNKTKLQTTSSINIGMILLSVIGFWIGKYNNCITFTLHLFYNEHDLNLAARTHGILVANYDGKFKEMYVHITDVIMCRA